MRVKDAPGKENVRTVRVNFPRSFFFILGVVTVQIYYWITAYFFNAPFV